MMDNHRLFHLAFAEENVNRNWTKVIFSDEVAFSSWSINSLSALRKPIQGKIYSHGEEKWSFVCPVKGRMSYYGLEVLWDMYVCMYIYLMI